MLYKKIYFLLLLQLYTPASGFNFTQVGKRLAAQLMRQQPLPHYKASAMKKIATTGKRIHFLTDVEGNWDYFERWIKKVSHSFHFDGQTLHPLENNSFVFGGDMTKHQGDYKVAQVLLNSKKTYPDHFTYLIGNRDANPFRFLRIRDLGTIYQRIDDPASSYVPGSRSPREAFITEFQLDPEMDLTSWLGQNISQEQAQMWLLKFMLREQMGLPNGFEERRKALAVKNTTSLDQIDDHSVKEAFLRDAEPDGISERYLKLAQIAYLEGNILFIHSAFSAENIGFIPPSEKHPEGYDTENLRHWVKQINTWHQSVSKQLVEGKLCVESPTFSPYDQYMSHPRHSVLNSSWFLNNNGGFKELDPKVAHSITRAGIKAIVSGHKPTGNSDLPMLLRCEYQNQPISVIGGDTSYSDHQAPDQRGIAVSDISLSQEGITIDSTRRDGSQITISIGFDQTTSMIGKLVCGDWLITAEIAPQTYLFRKKEGFKTKEFYGTLEELAKAQTTAQLN